MALEQNQAESAHRPVMLAETVALWFSDDSGRYIDCTFGRGGHSAALLRLLSKQGRLLALDRDPEAIAHGLRELGSDKRIELVHGAFDQLTELAASRGWQGQVSGVLFDLGVSSPQLDDARRGFSFMRDGPLDMRMDPTCGESAASWLARVEVEELERVLREYGEERFARRIAVAIVAAGRQEPLLRTAQLAKVVAEAHPRWPKDRHPATQSFQAIRIAINDELALLQRALEQALEVLAVGGHLVVISFHSLEDRIVKRFFRHHERGDSLPAKLPVPASMLKRRLRLLSGSKRASEIELAGNPRARSAVLRAAEKLA